MACCPYEFARVDFQKLSEGYFMNTHIKTYKKLSELICPQAKIPYTGNYPFMRKG